MNLTLREYRNLVKNAIKRSLPHCMDRFPKGRTFQEPDYTAGLAIGLPQLLNTPKLERLGLRFGGCFIHQSPLVTYWDGAHKVTRELGDLLILCRERIDDEERFNAALLQLKMAGEKKDVEAGQLKIYTQWPPLDFGRSVSSHPHYDVHPKTVTQGALYSFVHHEDPLRFTVASPDRIVVRDGIDNSSGIQLQEFLADFVIGLTGRTISNYPVHEDDPWSHLIWDIVERLHSAVFKRARISESNKDRFSRKQGAFFDFILDEGWLDDSMKKIGELLSADESLFGISGMLIVAKERKSENVGR